MSRGLFEWIDRFHVRDWEPVVKDHGLMDPRVVVPGKPSICFLFLFRGSYIPRYLGRYPRVYMGEKALYR